MSPNNGRGLGVETEHRGLLASLPVDPRLRSCRAGIVMTKLLVNFQVLDMLRSFTAQDKEQQDQMADFGKDCIRVGMKTHRHSIRQ